MDVDDRLGLRRRAGAGPAGDPRSRAKAASGATRDSGLTFTNFEVRQLRHRPPHRAPARAGGDPRGPARRRRHARRPAAERHLPRHRPAAGRRPPAQHGRRDASTSTPGRDSLALATDVHLRSALVRGDPARVSLAQGHGATCAGRFRSEGTLSRLAVDADLTGELGNVDARRASSRCCRRTGAPRTCCSRFTRLDLAALTGRQAPDRARRASSGHRQHRHAARARGRPRAGARPEPHSRVDPRQPLRPGRRARQRDPAGHRVRRMAGRARRRAPARLGWARAARRPDGASTSRPTASSASTRCCSRSPASTRDTSRRQRGRSAGAAAGRVDLAGSLDYAAGRGRPARCDGFEWQRIRSPRMTGSLHLARRPAARSSRRRAGAPTRSAWGSTGSRRLAGAVDGFADSLAWSGGTDAGRRLAVRRGGPVVARRDSARLLWVDTPARRARRCARYRLERAVR